MGPGTCRFIRSLLIYGRVDFSQFRIDKKFYQASVIVRWAVVIYDSLRNFPKPAFEGMVNGFLTACNEVGQHFNVYLDDML